MSKKRVAKKRPAKKSPTGTSAGLTPEEREYKHELYVKASLGDLALAASAAELSAAEGLYYLLTDDPFDASGGARVAAVSNSFANLHRLLCIALDGGTPLTEILSEADKLSVPRGKPEGTLTNPAARATQLARENRYVAAFVAKRPRATAVDYLNQVKSLYDKRNECIHSLEITFEDERPHLHKRSKDGAALTVTPERLMEPCILGKWEPGMHLAVAIQHVALELFISAGGVRVLPVAVQWYRQRYTARDAAAVVNWMMTNVVRATAKQRVRLNAVLEELGWAPSQLLSR